MIKFDDRIKLDTFRAQTTYQNDYKNFPLDHTNLLNCTKQSREEKEKIRSESNLPDNETFTKRRQNVQIPFNLLWRPKEITNTNPYEPFQTPVIESANTEEARKTRPRIYMSPAVCLDDVDDPERRNFICDHMYTTEWTKAIQETKVQVAKRHIADTTIEPCGGDPVELKIDLLPPLPEAFRNKGKVWETAQLKSTLDPTKTFWEHKESSVRCGCFDPEEGLIPEEKKQEIRELISQDKLRLAHDYPIPGYAGYRPRFSYGVSLAKVDVPVEHPFLSVSQVFTKRYGENKSQV